MSSQKEEDRPKEADSILTTDLNNQIPSNQETIGGGSSLNDADADTEAAVAVAGVMPQVGRDVKHNDLRGESEFSKYQNSQQSAEVETSQDIGNSRPLHEHIPSFYEDPLRLPLPRRGGGNRTGSNPGPIVPPFDDEHGYMSGPRGSFPYPLPGRGGMGIGDDDLNPPGLGRHPQRIPGFGGGHGSDGSGIGSGGLPRPGHNGMFPGPDHPIFGGDLNYGDPEYGYENTTYFI